MDLRLEQALDHDAVGDLYRRSFGAQGVVVAGLVEALRRDDPGALAVVAQDDGQVVGQVMFTRSRLDAPQRLLEIQVLSPLAVLPERQRQGIGSALIRFGLDRLDRQGVPLVFLEGDPEYYSGRGFLAGAELGFRKPSLRIPDDAFQVMKLSAYEPWMTGTLVYSATFWDHDCVGLRD